MAVSPSMRAIPLPSPSLAVGPCAVLYSGVPKNSICNRCWPSAQILNSLFLNFHVPFTCDAVTSRCALIDNAAIKQSKVMKKLCRKIDIGLFRRRDQIGYVNAFAELYWT